MGIRVYKKPIREYDMESANVSVLREKDLISGEMYLDIMESPKLTRNKLIGMLMRDNKDEDIYNKIKESINEYVDEFIITNGVSKKDILERSHDALFIGGTEDLKFTKFGDYVTFKLKHKYSMMIEFPISNEGKVHVKLYKTQNSIVSRYASIDKSHTCFCDLVNLFYFIANDKKVQFLKELKKFAIKIKNTENDLIKGVSNTYLCDILREIPF